MMTQITVFFVLLGIFLLWVLNRGRIRYWIALINERGWKSTVHYDRCLTVYRKLFDDTNAYKISIKERQEKNISDPSFTYGEVVFYSFVRIVEQASPQPGEIFYDLGSGGGKAVFIAALVFDFAKVYGIEKIAGLYDLSQNLVNKLAQLPERQKLIPYKNPQIEFIHADFRDVDISNGDVVFVNATCWEGEIFDAIIIKLLKLKKGARVILVSADLDNIGGFQLIYNNLHLMSWGMNRVNIYQRI